MDNCALRVNIFLNDTKYFDTLIEVKYLQFISCIHLYVQLNLEITLKETIIVMYINVYTVYKFFVYKSFLYKFNKTIVYILFLKI